MECKYLNRKLGTPLLAGLLLLGTTACTRHAEELPAKSDALKPMPEKIVTAWKEAGGEVGWARIDKLGMNVGCIKFVPEADGKAGDLPAFRFRHWQEGRLAKLPAPELAFGLILMQTQAQGDVGPLIALDNAGLKQLAAQKALQMLGLNNCDVTDEGLKELAGLKSLKALDLHATRVTDLGVKELAGLTGLQTLNLTGTKVTDAGLKELRDLKNMQTLGLGSTKQVTDAGLKELAGMKHLQALNLTSTRVTDAGVRELSNFDLHYLYLGDSQVTDEGLKSLARRKGLRWLSLNSTRVTDAGLKQLREALPQCEVTH